MNETLEYHSTVTPRYVIHNHFYLIVCMIRCRWLVLINITEPMPPQVNSPDADHIAPAFRSMKMDERILWMGYITRFSVFKIRNFFIHFRTGKTINHEVVFCSVP